MTSVLDLKLHSVPIAEQCFGDDPDPHMLAAREVHPWLAASDFGFVITDYDALDAILRKDDNLKTPANHVIELMGAEGSNWARFQREFILARDGEAHDRIRASVKHAFSPRAVATYRDRIHLVLSQLLDEWAPKGRFDFEEFATRFPITVMFGLFSIPGEKLESVRDWLEMIGQSFSLDQSLFPRISDAFDNMWVFIDGLIEARKASGPGTTPDLLDALIAGETERTMSPTELRDLILILFSGGYDTSRNLLGHIMNFMIDRPQLWRLCAEDRRYCDDVVDEALRYSGVTTTFRNVARSFEYQRVTFPEGVMLIFPLSIVCRYSGPFEDSLRFEPGRANAKRITSFGRGIHICLGQYLARLQIAEGLHLIAQRLRDPRHDGDVVWRVFPGNWGPKELPIVFEPQLT
jgi:cytochrome P450